jgi:hypothetical protein
MTRYILLSLIVQTLLYVSCVSTNSSELCSLRDTLINQYNNCVLTCTAADNIWGWNFNLVCTHYKLYITCIDDICYYTHYNRYPIYYSRSKFCGLVGYKNRWIDAPIEHCETEQLLDRIIMYTFYLVVVMLGVYTFVVYV